MVNFVDHTTAVTQGEKPTVLGVVGLAINSQGTTILSQSSGKTNLNATDAQAIDADSVFPLASCTKLITALAALRLVEQGTLDLDDTAIVEEQLPELCQQPIIASYHGKDFTYEPRKDGITARQLLTHTSGSSFDLIDPTLKTWRASRKEVPMSLTGALPTALEMPSVFQPGEGWIYGGGLDWIGLLISRITGISLGDFMRKEIFDVVGCDQRIGFNRLEIEQHGTLVQCTTFNKDGNLTAHTYPDAKSERGGGGLFASANNYLKILADLIAPEPRILRPETLDMLFTAQLPGQKKAQAAFRKASPIFGAMTGAMTASLSPKCMDHSLGGLLITEDNEALGTKTKGTMSWGGAFSSFWFVNREQGIAAFYGSSMFPPAQGVTKELMGEFVEEVWSRHRVS